MESFILGLSMLSVIAGYACAVASFIFFIVVVVRLASTGQTEMMAICLVMSLCFGLGAIIAYILGWGQRELRLMMWAWTAFVLAALVPAVTAVCLSLVAGA
jgi:hypothetical protein